MSEGQLGAKRRTRDAADIEHEEAAAFCARPACRQEYRRMTQPGRPQQYCSPVCRRTAEKELRRLRARLLHFQGVVKQTRIDLAAHGHDENAESTIDAAAVASNALGRAAGVLRFVGDSNDPLADELQRLFDAVRPVVAPDLQ